MGQEGERVEGYQGEARRQVIDGTLEKSVSASNSAQRSGVSFDGILQLCGSINRTGCVLAWCLVNAEAVSRMHGNANLSAIWFTSGVQPQDCPKRQPFPMSEGELSELVELLQKVALDEVVATSFTEQWSERCWSLVSFYGLNSLWSGGRPLPKGKWNGGRRTLAEAVKSSVQRMVATGSAMEMSSDVVKNELGGKRVTYTGEEVNVCVPLTFRQVLPSLPPASHGGAIDVLKFVSSSTRAFLLDPRRLVVEDVGQPLPRLQGKIHVLGDDISRISDELVSRGVCEWIPYDKVATYRQEKILNGLFGVAKNSSLEDGSPVLRLIMNLVPGNSVTRQIRGTVKNLPHITAWLSTYIEEGHELRMWQSDMSNAFYLFRIPSAWQPYLAFNVIREGNEVNGLSQNTRFCLACRVLPMGWSSSVGVMQEVSENILWHFGLGRDNQIMRRKAVPLWMVGILEKAKDLGQAWWHVYLDNFAAGEISQRGQTMDGTKLHNMAEAAWEHSGVISSGKKRKTGVLTAEELGAAFDGKERTMGVTESRLLKLIQATLWLIGRPRMSKRLIQIVVGRWVHVFQFRRPAMCCLSEVWKCVSSPGHGVETQRKAKQELLTCLSLVPVLHTFLGATVAKVVTASDASSTGGAVGIARELTPVGTNYVDHCLSCVGPVEIPVLVISLFNGIGGAFRCYDVLGVVPKGLIAFDVHQPAHRVTSRRWPHAELYGDVKTIDAALVEKWAQDYGDVLEVHCWSGFPCVDLSSVNPQGKGLEGRQSSLFYEVPRVVNLLAKGFPSHVEIKMAAENVASMRKEECQKISDYLEMFPYHLDCVNAVPMNRARLTWVSERLEGCMDGLQFNYEDYWINVKAPAEYPTLDQWITPGAEWPGYEWGQVLPTALKSIKRRRPPPSPAGIHRCGGEALARWESDDYRFPPYHYLERFLFWKNDKWRLANSSEKEILLGYGAGHTELCYSASKIKQSKVAFEDERLSLLGDSFSVFSFVIVAAALCRRFLGPLSYKHLALRMGTAPGMVLPLSRTAPLSRVVSYGNTKPSSQRDLQTLNRLLLARTNHTGSDVRISTGEVLAPKSLVRQSIHAGWWKWKPVFKVRWKHGDHINLLELRSILLSVKYHVQHLRHSKMRIFHITDSYVCMSICSKGRSGSRQLMKVLKQINAYLLGFQLYLVLAHVESSENPTDDASRDLEILLPPDESRASA